MTTAPTYTWSNPAGGDFNTATNWSGGVVPGTSDDADLVGLGAPYTVTVADPASKAGFGGFGGSATVHGFQTAAGTTLETTGVDTIFSAQYGTDGGLNAGTFEIGNYTVGVLGGTFTNTGAVVLASTGNIAGLLAFNLTLDGGGTVSLSDVAPTEGGGIPFANAIGAEGYFINVDNTISGAGVILSSSPGVSITNEVDGVVDASGVNPLFLGGETTIANAGLMEATGTGGLVLYGVFANSGTLAATGGTHFATLGVEESVALKGGGIVTLNAKGVIEGFATGATLTNVDNTILGGGFIETPLTLDNQAAGVIDADSGRMLINVAGTVTNEGLVESAGGGILLVSNTTIDSSGGGTVEAGKQIQLNKATLLGGALDIEKGASLLSSTFASTINLDGGTVTNAGNLEGAGGGLTVDGGVANTGLVIAETGALTITGAITGTGRIEVFGKQTLEIDGAQGGTVAFGAGSTGRLVLGDSAAFAGTITGFSKTGANSIDLKDIDFADALTPVYVANTKPGTGGTLSVSDGTHTATIKLSGADYSASTFDLAADGGTGVIVTDSSPHAFVAAMAGFAPATASAAGSPRATGPTRLEPLIAAPS